MSIRARYVHTNLIAKDWVSLARFYERVFGCVRLPPERHYQGKDLDRGTGLENARLDGVHLRLPSQDREGPTLEIFSYSSLRERPPAAVNRPGYGHIAFEVDDVAASRQQILKEGGAGLGAIVTLAVSEASRVTWCYVTDPEGNMIELQSWSHDA